MLGLRKFVKWKHQDLKVNFAKTYFGDEEDNFVDFRCEGKEFAFVLEWLIMLMF